MQPPDGGPATAAAKGLDQESKANLDRQQFHSKVDELIGQSPTTRKRRFEELERELTIHRRAFDVTNQLDELDSGGGASRTAIGSRVGAPQPEPDPDPRSWSALGDAVPLDPEVLLISILVAARMLSDAELDSWCHAVLAEEARLQMGDDWKPPKA
uniref:Uncharacterized protein n=1 Tax=Coccolithus braarudii TaxID=221442 RepID=A0A7S0LBX9_9EUKA|mmetsp:Transcript_29577/g.63679  ORF Transcript_29577/g.63679 Transcript_29577/m.63679 type:complete len:156 (+) Transcript_29577:214-681(+)